jgi:hypothetical protein
MLPEHFHEYAVTRNRSVLVGNGRIIGSRGAFQSYRWYAVRIYPPQFPHLDLNEVAGATADLSIPVV